MALDPKHTEQAWAVWFRNGLEPEGKWCCWEGTISLQRSGAIDNATKGFGGMKDRKDWRRLRRKGVVAARRTLLTARLPEADDE